MDYKALLASIAGRLREPSTYAGIALLIGAIFHITVSDGDMKLYADIGTGVAGIITIYLREQSAPSKIEVKELPPVDGSPK